MSGPGRGSGRRRRRRRHRPKQSTTLIFPFFCVFHSCSYHVSSLSIAQGYIMCEMCMIFHGFSRFSKGRRFCERQGDRYSPSPSFADGMAPSNIKTGFQHRPTLLSTRKATRKISGGVAQMVERSLRTMSFPAGTNLFFFSFFSREGRRPPPRPTQSVRRKTAEHTHTHTPPRETRRDETLARALDAIGEVVRGLLVSRAQPGFPQQQQQQQQRILSIHTHPP